MPNGLSVENKICGVSEVGAPEGNGKFHRIGKRTLIDKDAMLFTQKNNQCVPYDRTQNPTLKFPHATLEQVEILEEVPTSSFGALGIEQELRFL